LNNCDYLLHSDDVMLFVAVVCKKETYREVIAQHRGIYYPRLLLHIRSIPLI